MPRHTTAYLRTILRQTVSDALGTDAELSEDELERCLDRTAELAVLPLSPWNPTRDPAGATVWRAPLAPWEEGVQVVDGVGVTLTPASVDHWNGIVKLSSPSTARLYIAGTVFDFDAAAAEAFLLVASRWARRYDVSVDGQAFDRSAVAQRATELAREYLTRARPRVARQVRGDVEAEAW